MKTKLVFDQTGHTPFQNMLFGLNAEITRKGFFGGLSAEMLNNRKLYAGEGLPEGCCLFICSFPDIRPASDQALA